MYYIVLSFVFTTKAKLYCMTKANKVSLILRINRTKASKRAGRGEDEFSLTTSDISSKPITQCFFLTWSFRYDIHRAEMSQQEKWQPWASFSGEKREILFPRYTLPPVSGRRGRWNRWTLEWNSSSQFGERHWSHTPPFCSDDRSEMEVRAGKE